VSRKTLFFLIGSAKLGGTEKVAKLIGDALNRQAYDVFFVALLPEHDYEFDQERVFTLLSEKPRNLISGFLKSYFSLHKLIRIHRPRAIVSFSIGLNLFLFFHFFRRTFFVIDTNIFALKRKSYYKYLTRIFALFPHVRRVIVPSNGLHAACKIFFYNEFKLIVIGNPVDIDAISTLKNELLDEDFLQDKKFIVFAGRLVRMKGVEGIMSAYSKSLLRDTCKLVILGKGEFESELRRKAQEMNLDDHVFFLGFKANPYKYFFRAKLFVLNSRFESFGNVLIEALATGVPVLSSDCDFGPRDIIMDGQNGGLFKVNDVNELMNKLNDVVSDDELYRTLCSNAAKSVEPFYLDSVVRLWIEILEK